MRLRRLSGLSPGGLQRQEARGRLREPPPPLVMGGATFLLVVLLAAATFLIGRIDQFTPGLMVAVAGIGGVALAVTAALATAEYLGAKELDQARVELLALHAELDLAAQQTEAQLHDARAIGLALGAAVHALGRNAADPATVAAIEAQVAFLQGLLTPASTTPLEPVPLAEVAADVQSLARLRSVSAEVSLPQDGTVLGDRAGIARVFGNLIDNAAKYARGSVLRLGSEPAGPYLHLTIEDDGPGVGDIDPETLFAPGVRGGERAPGFGIGLAAARRAAQAMQGALWYERRPGQGSRFVLKLALPPQHPEPPG